MIKLHELQAFLGQSPKNSPKKVGKSLNGEKEKVLGFKDLLGKHFLHLKFFL
jgi:hypothetical protein